jgi:hypothetical protein
MRTLVVNRQPGKEAVELQADFAALERLAIFGGHRAVRVYDSEKLVNELMSGIKPRSFKKTETSSIWDNYLVMILITSLLAIEWVCRKRIGLP